MDQTDRAAIDGTLSGGSQPAVNRFGEIDILSINAGIDEPTEPAVANTTDDGWEETFRSI